jgi:pyrroloquinoline-quinone synthase
VDRSFFSSSHHLTSAVILAAKFHNLLIETVEEIMTNMNALTATEFERNLQAAIMEYSMLKHPFYVAWTEGKLSQAVLSEYAKQYYAHVRAFPTYVSAVHSSCDDLQIRQDLLENLIEEERGTENHPELWLRFAEGLGVAREDVRDAELLPATVDSVARLKSLTRSEDYRDGLAALYAYESQIPEVARTKRAGLKDFYGIEDERSRTSVRSHSSEFMKTSTCFTNKRKSRCCVKNARLQMNRRRRWKWQESRPRHSGRFSTV